MVKISDETAIKAKLEAEKKRTLEQKYQREANDEPMTSFVVSDRAEQANGVNELEKAKVLSNQNIAQLAKIERAMIKMEEGTYGLCDRCGHRIDPARLEAMPWAVNCQECPSGFAPVKIMAAVQSSRYNQHY